MMRVPDAVKARKAWRAGAVVVAVLAIAALFMWRVFNPGEQEEAGAIAPQVAHIARQDGQTVVVMDSAARVRAGIATTALPVLPFRRRGRAYGGVVSVEELGADRTRFARARARAEQASIAERTARAERDRVRSLYDQDRNMALKALQRAEADWATADAEAEAAASAERSERSRIEERWGSVLGGWIRRGSGPIGRVLDRTDVVVEVTLPPGVALAAPPDTVFIRTSSGPPIPARFLALAPRSDPRIQGTTLFCVARARPALVPGRSVVAFVPLGDAVEATLIPASAVIWAEGSAWIYMPRGTDGFARRRISTDVPTETGYALTGLTAGTPVVTRGAQILLSEEYRAQIEVGEGG